MINIAGQGLQRILEV